MTKLLATALLLVLAACGGEDPVVRPSVGAPPQQGGPTSAPGFPNVPIPRVSPAPPAAGEPATIEMRIEGAGGVPLGSRDGPADGPDVFVSRSREEAEVIARALPQGAASLARDWKAYGRRALVILTAGAQPDAGYRIALGSIEVTEEGKVVTASGEVTRQDGVAAQVITVPWVVASVPYPAVVLAERCVLSLTGGASRQSRCHGAR